LSIEVSITFSPVDTLPQLSQSSSFAFYRLAFVLLFNKLWNIVAANTWLKEVQKDIFARKPLSSSRYSGQLPLLDLSTKVMSCLGLCLLEHASSSPTGRCDDVSLTFIASCVISCMEGAYDLLKSWTIQDDQTSVFGSQTSAGDFFFSPDAQQCVGVIARGCSLLCLLLTSARRILRENHASPLEIPVVHLSENALVMMGSTVTKVLSLLAASGKLGSEGDVCFRACLALMRSAVALTHLKQERKIERQTVVAGNENDKNESNASDAFHEIDDDAFWNIDLDHLVSEALEQRKACQSQVRAQSQVSGSQNLAVESVAVEHRLELLDTCAGGDLWNFLESALVLSKVRVHTTLVSIQGISTASILT